MRALVLSGTGWQHLAVQRVPVPRPAPTQLLARVDAAGICTSLLKLIDQGPRHSLMAGWDPALYPIILGDEGSITLVEVGEALRDRYAVGERYVGQPAVDLQPINHRERYRDNAATVHKIATGYTLPGSLAEYVLIPEEVIAAQCIVRVPDDRIPYAHAALGEPLSCAISSQEHHVHLAQAHPHAPREASIGLKRGGITVIIGAGAMGRMNIDIALSYRPAVLIAADHHDERLAKVQALFGERASALDVRLETVNTYTTDLKALVDEVTQTRGADDIIVSVGNAKAIEEAQPLVGRGAVINLFGGLKKGEDVVPFDTGAIHYKEINVTGSSGGSPGDVARALDLMARGESNPAAHITRIGDLDHVVELLGLVKARALDGKAVVYPHRRSERILAVEQWTAHDEATYLAD
jgi:threonine dehydrogenase-like Zn-dependent dehydrogenase